MDPAIDRERTLIEMIAVARESHISPDALADYVFDAAQDAAKKANHVGLESQINLLLDYYGPARLRQILSTLA